MRKLIILSGPPGSGKSTFVKENGLSEYTLCYDKIRLMFDAPQMYEHGSSISQKNNKIVFQTMHYMIESRMQKGVFTVIDGTHTSEKEFAPYKTLCKKFRYKMIIIPFNTSIDVLLERNKHRGIKSVPEEIISKMKARFDQLEYTFGTVVQPKDFKEYIKYQPSNLNDYKAIHHIGDIHGCFTVLENILPLKDDEFYIFLGDYFDRGVENAKVAEWILKNYERKNVVFLRGNHECHLNDYVNEEEVKSLEFEKTIAEFGKHKIKKKELKMFALSLLDVYLYSYRGKKVLCSHGGVSKYPDNINLINPSQFIRGVGSYSTDIDKIFEAPENVFQVHGHRNLLRLPIEASKKSFNLTDDVEYGGYLRTLTLNEHGFSSMKYKNNVFAKEDNSIQKNMFEGLIMNKDIQVSKFGNLLRINHKKENQTTYHNSLYINEKNYKVAGRGYKELRNINYNESEKIKTLPPLNYPLIGYIKENGFQGILGIDEDTEQLIFISNGILDGEHSKQFEAILRAKLSKEELDKLRLELILRNNCLLFEVIDNELCPQIISNNNTKDVVLLDVIERDYEFEKKPYNYVVNLARQYGFAYKRKALTIKSQEELFNILANISKFYYTYKGNKIKGFTIEDEKGFQIELTSYYFAFWKKMKTIMETNSLPSNMTPQESEVIEKWKSTGATFEKLMKFYK